MDLMSTKEAADFLGFSEGTLENWRTEGKGPKYYKPSGKVYYTKEDLVDWVKSGESQQ